MCDLSIAGVSDTRSLTHSHQWDAALGVSGSELHHSGDAAGTAGEVFSLAPPAAVSISVSAPPLTGPSHQ
ncbi:UNVERIFIED_CONTAM: hypothetical protein FKN15_023527 [Acipenser sinensis]